MTEVQSSKEVWRPLRASEAPLPNTDEDEVSLIPNQGTGETIRILDENE